MPAATIAALLDYETNIEDALKAHFQNTLPTTQILTPRVLIGTAPILTTPRITLVVGITGTNANQTATRANTSQDYDSHKLGTVQAIGTTRRDGTGQSLGTIRGNIRQAMLQATAALNVNTLPYYQVITLREGSCVSLSDAENDEISTQITYNLEFYIKPDQWPAS
jgi:hypothetical protein